MYSHAQCPEYKTNVLLLPKTCWVSHRINKTFYLIMVFNLPFFALFDSQDSRVPAAMKLPQSRYRPKCNHPVTDIELDYQVHINTF
jgi:hypothetical protein